MSDMDHATLVRKGYDAMAAADAATVVDMFADDGVLHVSNVGPLGGDHKGHETITALLVGLYEWTGGTIRFDVEEIFADEEHGIVVLRETATRERDGATLDVRETHLFRFEGDRVVDFWDLPAPADRERHDAFFS